MTDMNMLTFDDIQYDMLEGARLTPPTASDLDAFEELQCPGGSASSKATFSTNNWSPASYLTASTTPPRSPARIRDVGASLLPRVRTQDLVAGLMPIQQYGLPLPQPVHGRALSLPANDHFTQFGGNLPVGPQLCGRSPSPLGFDVLVTAVSEPSPQYTYFERPSAATAAGAAGSTRSVSASNIRTHSRNASSCGNIDASVLSRYGFPTYRHSPGPQSATAHGVPMSRTPSAMSFLAPIALPGAAETPPCPRRRRTTSPPVQPSRPPVEVDARYEPAFDHTPDTTALEYLTAPNPAPPTSLQVAEGLRSQNVHFWYDVRNVRRWDGFNVEAIRSFSILWKLLQCQVRASELPEPARVHANPDSPAQLAELCANHYAVKVNAALKVTQGERHMAVRALSAGPSARRRRPEFVSNFQSDTERTVWGDGRGRVVGIVKCSAQWNSGMRDGPAPQKVRYLHGLAQLHHYMREHGCRYGFVVTETELVCVRGGGPPREDNVPLFGFLELSGPIPLSADAGDPTAGTTAATTTTTTKMTACLALWWLHTLAGDAPLPGQYGWSMDVRGPTARTRSIHLGRDDWMPKIGETEKREAKRARGWVWPEEPLSRRECVRGRKTSRN